MVRAVTYPPPPHVVLQDLPRGVTGYCGAYDLTLRTRVSQLLSSVNAWGKIALDKATVALTHKQTRTAPNRRRQGMVVGPKQSRGGYLSQHAERHTHWALPASHAAGTGVREQACLSQHAERHTHWDRHYTHRTQRATGTCPKTLNWQRGTHACTTATTCADAFTSRPNCLRER